MKPAAQTLDPLLQALQEQATALANGNQDDLERANLQLAQLLKQLPAPGSAQARDLGHQVNAAQRVSLKNTVVGSSKMVQRKRASTQQGLEALGLGSLTYTEGASSGPETQRKKRNFIA
jgi:hypothetical protein